MKPILILYATREGHTQRVATHVAEALRARGYVVDVFDACHSPGPSPSKYRAAILAASVHRWTHERELVKLAKKHHRELTRMPVAFLSVSLAAATVEDEKRSEAQRARAREEVRRWIDSFLDATALRPVLTKPVAGALLYSRYSPLDRFIMSTASRLNGGPTDTSKDYVYTDWAGLDRFVDEFIQVLSLPEWTQPTRIALPTAQQSPS